MNIKIQLVFNEENTPYLLDISSLLYDFELLHDFSLVICSEEYSDYRFSRYFWYRNGRPVKKQHRLRAARIIKESPLTIELIFAGITVFSGALWVMVQAIERIRDWNLNKEKLRREVEKLRIENQLRRVELDQKIQEKKASFEIFNSLMRRLESNSINLVDMNIDVDENNRDTFTYR